MKNPDEGHLLNIITWRGKSKLHEVFPLRYMTRACPNLGNLEINRKIHSLFVCQVPQLLMEALRSQSICWRWPARSRTSAGWFIRAQQLSLE